MGADEHQAPPSRTQERFGMQIPQKFLSHNRSQIGAAAVEFALVAGILFTLVFGIIEFGRVYSQLQVFNSAAREGARVAAVRGTSDEIEDAVITAAAGYDLDETPVADKTCDDSSHGQPVTVSWNQHFEISLGLLPPVDKDLEIKGVFRCE
jgi:Flp pilus assembly protein TadG